MKRFYLSTISLIVVQCLQTHSSLDAVSRLASLEDNEYKGQITGLYEGYGWMEFVDDKEFEEAKVFYSKAHEIEQSSHRC